MDAKHCPRCGRSFTSIRCQKCGFTGEEDFFDQGCPVCGYSASASPVSGGKKRIAAGALPVWVYALTLLALLIVGGVLYFSLR
jgi:hypothetical protein